MPKRTDLKSMSIQTRAVSLGVDTDATHGAVMPPLYLSSNFSFEGLGKKRSYDYARSGHPNRDLIADVIAELEGGAGCVMTASGLAALDLLWQDLPGQKRVIAPHDCYGGTQRLLNARAKQGLIALSYVDQGDDQALKTALAQGAELVLIETPSNPLMRVVDLKSIIDLSHEAGAKVAVDNTFLSPALQNPIALGADYVVHSTTKYINGQSDVIGGAIVVSDPAEIDIKKWWANCLGSGAPAFDSYLTLRGIRTLFVRIHQQQKSAQILAEFLHTDPKIAKVYYPGLTSHPGHDIAARQQKGFGAMMSFELKGGIEAVAKLVDNISVFTLAESLGGVESLIVHPASMTHAAMSPEAQATAGISPSLVRLSIGLEDVDDLKAALAEALDRV